MSFFSSIIFLLFFFQVEGPSVSNHEVEVCWGYLCVGEHRPDYDHLNGAQTGAMLYNVVDSPGNQLDYVLDQLEKNPNVSMAQDWKVLSLFVGSNEMCVQCEEFNIQPSSPEDYEKYFRTVLTQLRQRVPRLFVNVISLFNVSLVYDVSKRSSRCETIHRDFEVECGCAFEDGAKGDARRRKMNDLAVTYNRILDNVTREFMANASDDFAVVIQPALRDGRAEDFPVDFLSTLDCFHPSMAAHEAMAKVVWNNMLLPAAEKKTAFNFDDPFVCPTADSIFPVD